MKVPRQQLPNKRVSFRSREIPYKNRCDCLAGGSSPAGAAGLPRSGSTFPFVSIFAVQSGLQRVKANVPFPQFFSTMAKVTPTTSLYLSWNYQRRQTQSLLNKIIKSSEVHKAFGRDIRYYIDTYMLLLLLLLIILLSIYNTDIELWQSANGNNHFSMLWFTLKAHWSMGSSSFASVPSPPRMDVIT